MNKKMLILPLAMACFAAVGFAEGEQQKVAPYDQGHAILDNQFPSGYNHQARIDVDGWDVFITGSFIYWQAIEGGLELGMYNDDPTERWDDYNSVVNMNFSYKPGFKVALGTQLDHDNWILSAEYTWLHFADSKAIVVDDVNFMPGWAFHLSTLDTAAAEWKLRYDIIDLEMSRPYYVGTHLTLKPFGALRGGLIKQKYDFIGIDLTEIEREEILVTYETYMVEKTWLVGPRVGINCDWMFFDYFRLIGNASAALFYQHFKTIGFCVIDIDDDEIVSWNAYNTEGQLTPNLQGAIGFGWGSYFGEKNGWHFDLSALYEVNYLFDQNKMRQEVTRNMISDYVEAYIPAANLMMHGLTITARVDF